MGVTSLWEDAASPARFRFSSTSLLHTHVLDVLNSNIYFSDWIHPILNTHISSDSTLVVLVSDRIKHSLERDRRARAEGARFRATRGFEFHYFFTCKFLLLSLIQAQSQSLLLLLLLVQLLSLVKSLARVRVPLLLHAQVLDVLQVHGPRGRAGWPPPLGVRASFRTELQDPWGIGLKTRSRV